MRQSLGTLFVFCLVPKPTLAMETVRIAIGDVDRQVSLNGKSLKVGTDSEEATYTAVEGNRAMVRVAGDRFEINGNAWTNQSVRFRAGDPSPDNAGLGSEEIRAGDIRVRGDVVVRKVRGRLQLINVLSLEEYLLGVLGSEMPHDFPFEALKAQAVAARTYALQKKLSSLDEPYHLGSSVLHQVYGGLSREDKTVRAAVEASRGEVLTYELEPIEAYFHASCGGRTESGIAALGRDLPYLKPVDCPCGRLRESHWELDLSQSELESALEIQQSVDLVPTARSSTGRVTAVRLGQNSTLDGTTLRQRLGYSKLKSLWFNVESGSSGSVKIKGRGHGHGAGLCQWGARLYAQAGRNYREILMHYYSGVELQKLY